MAFSVRRPAVAGTFYPASPSELRFQVEKSLEGDGAPPAAVAPKAVIAPHAGYAYSGLIAGSAFRTLAPAAASIRRVILLGPSHFVALRGLALPDTQRFETPLGQVTVDPEGAGAVLRLPQVRVIPEAHVREHSLEVEVPFLQVLLEEDFTLVPLAVGEASPEEVAEVLDRLWGGPETVVVVSSDLSHFLSYDEARQVDRETAAEIVGLAGPLHGRQACGARPINGLLETARRRGMTADLLDLRSSGDTAGDRSRVVGYGAFAFHERS